MFVRMFRALVAALVTLAVLTGCAATSKSPTVVAAFYPLQFVAQQVIGEHGTVANLTPAGQEPHDLSLTVAQTAQLARAKVVLYEKGFQPQIDQSVANDAQGTPVDATTYVGLTTSKNPEEPGTDPHFWLDPNLLAKVVVGFTDVMARKDPKHAQAYRKNADALERRLAQLDRDYRAGLARCRTHAVVVSHDAFEYLGRRYGLTVIPIAGLSPDAEPSPQHLAQLRTLSKRDHVTTVFTETLASPKLADTLARELGVHTAVLDPLEGLKPGTHGNYFTVMRANLAAIQQAIGCT